jgi:hypothetical protein
MLLIVVTANFKVPARYLSGVIKEKIGNTSVRITGFWSRSNCQLVYQCDTQI